jgi:ABC-type nitrate/sulfonate/bicarbonate transport system substrate-binding protein
LVAKFLIEPHFRLQEWVAHEKGYFAAEGLEYEFRELIRSSDGEHHAKGDRSGAFQSIEKGREADVSCACHWTVNVAASRGHAKLYADVYSVAPSGIFVSPDSPVQTPSDLIDVPISVGYQSGSHYSTIQALEQYMPTDRINLSFKEGMLFARMELLLDRKVPAAALFSGPYYFAEQLGFRKVIDNTFMIATMFNGSPDPDDIRKYFSALKKAQRDIDVRPELYTHYYTREFPARFHDRMDTRRWGPGERIVFEPYTKEVFEKSFEWIGSHGIFEAGKMGAGDYDRAVVSLV